jgi:hypothetical protein
MNKETQLKALRYLWGLNPVKERLGNAAVNRCATPNPTPVIQRNIARRQPCSPAIRRLFFTQPAPTPPIPPL